MSDITHNEQAIVSDDESGPAFSFEQWTQNLLEQTKEDITAPYMPENLHVIAQLKLIDLALFERLRINLNKLDVPLGRFDDAVKQQEKNMRQENAAEQRNATDSILDVTEGAEFFHTPDGIAYADIFSGDGHRETWPILSKGFKRWVIKQYFSKLKKTPAAEALNSALSNLEARAIIDGQERPIFIRTAVTHDTIYVDLCDDKKRVIEITKDGYKFVDTPLVRFQRKKGMRPLPLPESGGTIDELRPFLNVKDDNGFVLIISWLLMALSGHGPYPILVVVGEQGTAKSTLMELVRQLVDPHTAPLRTLPRDARDLFIAASNALVLAFDNLSYMADFISDALCRLSTGGGFATRALYSDDDEMLFDAMRPILINGIENVGTRGDLVDRAIILRLEPIPENKRKPAKQLQAEFDAARPRIFGALLDMIAHGLKNLPDTKLERQPRMADFALWVTACETAAAWPPGTFMAAYEANRAEANIDVIAASSLATAVCDFLHQGRKEWIGTATDLLKELRTLVEEQISRDKRIWPQTPKNLSEKLTRVAPALRRVGVEIDRQHGKDKQRLIKLFRTPVGLNAAPPAPFAPGLIAAANGGGSPQTGANASKQKKVPKFARQPKKK